MRVLKKRVDGVVQNYHKKPKEDEEYWKQKPVLTEREINLIKNRINSGRYKRFVRDDGWELTPEQNQKGYKWLMSLYKTPRGVEREKMPYGYREMRALDTFLKITLIDWYSTASYGQRDWYVPYYRVEGGAGSFGYCVYGGEIHILG